MTVPNIGQPYSATVTFRDGAGELTDPVRVLMSASPYGIGATPLEYGVDDAVTNPSPGVYRLVFTVTQGGRWSIVADGFDGDGEYVGTASTTLDVADPGVTTTADAATSIAIAVVEEELRRPLRYVEDQTLTAYAEDGLVRLPFRPVRKVTSVVYADTGNPARWTLAVGRLVYVDRMSAPVTVVYDHGWHENEVPPIIGAIIDTLKTRIAMDPGGSISRETMGATYSVDYRVSGLELTQRERDLLRSYRCTERNATLRTGYTPVDMPLRIA